MSRKSHAVAVLIYQYAEWLKRWYRFVLFASLVVAAGGTYYSVRLYQNLRTDLEELLPETAQSVRDLKAVAKRVGGLNHLSVVIESSDREAGLRFQKDMSARLRELPSDLVARVEDNIQKERAFFEKNKSLYMDYSDWERIQEYVRARIRYERRGKKEGAEAPAFDFDGLKKKYSDLAGQWDRFPDGYFESRDGRTHVILAFLPGKVTNVGTNQRLSEAAHRIAEELNPKSYAPDLVVGFDGDVQNVVEEHHGLIEDLILSSVVVTVLVAGALLLFFRSLAGVFALLGALMTGTAATFGMSYLLVGYLNANTAFLGSIVLGNGINFGIIMLARYLEERRSANGHRSGRRWEEAIPRAIAFTAEATWTAAIAAGLAYASLVLTDFRGFNQFGVIGGLGMFLCWLATFTTLPALLILVEKRGWLKARMGQGKPVVALLLSRFVQGAHKPIFVLTLVSIVASSYFVAGLGPETIESDFSKLRNKESVLHGAGHWGKKVDAVFERYLTPTLILTNDVIDTEPVIKALKELKEKEGESSPIADFKRVEDFMPKDQSRKIRVIETVRSLLPPRAIAKLGSEDRKLVDELLPRGELKPLHETDLPPAILLHFREMDGTIGRMVHVFPRLQTGNFWDAREIVRFAEKMREAIRNSGVSAFIAGQPPLSADMISAITTDGPKATVFAFLAVVILVVLVFQQWKQIIPVVASLSVGVLWMGGIIGLYDLKINFLNFIALPITFGIGVDYVVNIFARYKIEGRRVDWNMAKIVETTGGAVALCSATTIIGYSSLLIAGSQAFVSFGTLAVLGEFTCLLSALVALPAAWRFLQGQKRVAGRRASQPGRAEAHR